MTDRQHCYDLNDNLEKVWDANHPRASHPDPTQLYAYDALNRLETPARLRPSRRNHRLRVTAL